ncbi:hypothetical protein FIV41_27805 [Pseudomonas marginalis]|uniref:Uncharacterized protein n=1 Tax=Pseudomonas marginalis TaxID=298 RepID=A0A9X9FV94_PSEMA|nr:hypothetical protein [Pseudomonas marginalis]TWR51749.1 hypothetical protein FIV41_27805 [Pseudomonas marginalis]
MNQSTHPKSRMLEIVKFSRRLSIEVINTVVTAWRVETIYLEIKSAIKNSPTNIKNDNLITRGAMQDILHRDMFILLAALSRMEKNLIRSARTQIKSGETRENRIPRKSQQLLKQRKKLMTV